MKIKIPKKIEQNFNLYKNIFNKYCENWKDENPVIGKLWWTIPEDVIWVYATDNEEDYEGSQTQIGFKKDGTLVWGYFSHCSCYGYEDYKGDFEELDKEHLIHTEKHYELKEVDENVLSIIEKRIKDIDEK